MYGAVQIIKDGLIGSNWFVAGGKRPITRSIE